MWSIKKLLNNFKEICFNFLLLCNLLKAESYKVNFSKNLNHKPTI